MSETKTKTLVKKIILEGTIETLTGLHIGGTNTALQIGGLDNAIIRNPLNNRPYIPGSSLKGKIRSLLEQSAGTFGPSVGKDVQHGASNEGKIAELFGRMSDKVKGLSNIPSRILFRDCDLIDEDNALLNSKSTDLPYTEVKTEVVLDRITASATPRQLERVPSGVFFKLNIVINIFTDEPEDEFVQLLFKGMQLLQNDCLGGKGSRGSGQIKFHITSVKERTSEAYSNATIGDTDYTKIALPSMLKAEDKELAK